MGESETETASGLTRELVVGLEGPDGEIEVGWNLRAVAMLGGSEPTGEALWRTEPAPSPGSRLRVLTARLTDGRCLLIAAIRGPGARHHGDEVLAGALLGEEQIEALDRILLSAEYDGTGATRRISIEAELGEDGGLRAAGERRDETGERRDGFERVALDLRSDGVAGVGLLETLSPPR